MLLKVLVLNFVVYFQTHSILEAEQHLLQVAERNCIRVELRPELDQTVSEVLPVWSVDVLPQRGHQHTNVFSCEFSLFCILGQKYQLNIFFKYI